MCILSIPTKMNQPIPYLVDTSVHFVCMCTEIVFTLAAESAKTNEIRYCAFARAGEGATLSEARVTKAFPQLGHACSGLRAGSCSFW